MPRDELELCRGLCFNSIRTRTAIVVLSASRSPWGSSSTRGRILHADACGPRHFTVIAAQFPSHAATQQLNISTHGPTAMYEVAIQRQWGVASSRHQSAASLATGAHRQATVDSNADAHTVLEYRYYE